MKVECRVPNYESLKGIFPKRIDDPLIVRTSPNDDDGIELEFGGVKCTVYALDLKKAIDKCTT